MPFPPPPVPASLTVGNVNAGHVTLDTNGARFYSPDGVTIVLEFDNATGNLTLSDGTILASTITGATLAGSAITGSTVTGGTVETAASGQRVVLNGATDQLELYDSAGTLVGVIRADPSGELIINYPPGAATVQLDAAGVHILGGLDAGNTTVATLTALANAIISGGITAASLTASGGVAGTTGTFSAAVQGSTVTSTTGDLTAQNTCTCLNPPTTTTAANVWMNTSTGRLNKVTSARRFKTRIRRLRDGARVLALRPVSFQDKAQAKADPAAPRIWGLIADEVAQVAPDLVSYDDRGQPEGVMYDRVVVGLIDVVRDLEQRCAAAGV